jgi:8-oxo-dGTP pyrophosphatase MutT (NUDIX family)
MKKIFLQIKQYTFTLLPLTDKRAAVMIILLQQENHPVEIVLTKRSPTLSDYAGHYSFPGGMFETQDADLLATAMRETQEELNLLPENYEIIGQLDDIYDRYSNVVRPFVALMNKKDFIKQFRFSDAEVTDVYFLPITKLIEIKDDPNLHAITRRRPSYAYTDNDVFVWGLTAAILVNLFKVLSNK